MLLSLLCLFACLTFCTGATFEPCSKDGPSKTALCFKTVLSEISVKIGDDGTNDDVTIEVCSDVNPSSCCKTDKLKSLLSDDWSKGDEEKWGPSHFGKCKDTPLLVKRGLTVTLSKEDDDTLLVTSIVISTKSPDASDKKTEKFTCPDPWSIGGKNGKNSKTQLCRGENLNANDAVGTTTTSTTTSKSTGKATTTATTTTTQTTTTLKGLSFADVVKKGRR